MTGEWCRDPETMVSQFTSAIATHPDGIAAGSTLEAHSFWPTVGSGAMLPTVATVFLGGTSIFGGRGTIFGMQAFVMQRAQR